MAQDRLRPPEATERNHFAVFFNAILALEFHQAIYDAIWKRFSGPIRMILDNQFVFQPFWNYHAGRGGEDWERSFEHSKRIVTRALAAHDTAVILSTLFNRLYVLRIQLMHGGASWDSSVNRDQVRDGGSDNGISCTHLRGFDDVTPRRGLGSTRLPCRELTRCQSPGPSSSSSEVPGTFRDALVDGVSVRLEVWPKSGRKGLYSWQSMMGESGHAGRAI